MCSALIHVSDTVVASKVALDKSKASSYSLSMSSLSDGQHVIFPNHFQVSEAFKNSLTFGSFDACLGGRTEIIDASGTVGDDKSSLGVESSQGSDVTVQESSPRLVNVTKSHSLKCFRFI